MTDTVSSQLLADGIRNCIIKLLCDSDGTGETEVIKVDMSTLNGAPSDLRLDKIQYDIQGMSVKLIWDADTDIEIIQLSPGQGEIDTRCIAGLPNNSVTGKTGDIKLTSLPMVNVEDIHRYSIILHCKKKYHGRWTHNNEA